MNRTLLLMAVAAVATSGVKAQSVTYNHDSPKQNQITVMETGTGALSPELYYTLLHNKYKKSAASKNKLSFRTLAGVNLYNQTDEAEAIDSALCGVDSGPGGRHHQPDPRLLPQRGVPGAGRGR